MTATPHMDDTSIDSGVPWHYGEPLKEQRAMSRGEVRIDLSHKGVVTVTGEDRHTWLHSLLTQEITSEFSSTHSLILSPHGHIEHDLHIINDGPTVWIIVEPGTAAALTSYLTSMRFMLRVEVQNVTNEFAVVGASGHVQDDRFPTWHSPLAFVKDSQVVDRYVAHRPESWMVTEFVVPRTEIDTALEGHALVGTWAWEAARVRAGVPRLNFESDHKSIPHELGLIAAAVHLNKGCYRGQETIARVYNLGKPPRRLVMLDLDGSTNEMPELGSDVVLDGTVVGRLTSLVQDFEHGPLGLAVVKRSTPTDAVFDVAGISAAQTVIVE